MRLEWLKAVYVHFSWIKKNPRIQSNLKSPKSILDWLWLHSGCLLITIFSSCTKKNPETFRSQIQSLIKTRGHWNFVWTLFYYRIQQPNRHLMRSLKKCVALTTWQIINYYRKSIFNEKKISFSAVPLTHSVWMEKLG